MHKRPGERQGEKFKKKLVKKGSEKLADIS